jgi:hypothetical protein
MHAFGGNMKSAIERIEALDLSLFDGIDSESTTEDRRSLLAVQRAIARRKGHYAYLEIGSHLGGSIQPHLVDSRCNRIYSIDPRPLQQSDDRPEVKVCYFDNNSTERMLERLRAIAPDGVSKIQCFELDASQIDPHQIPDKPQLAFIDGEHTRKAALSDFDFCSQVISADGAVVFHDFGIIFPAIQEICRSLGKRDQKCVPLKLEGSVFAFFFDPGLIDSDPYLSSIHRLHKNLLLYYPVLHRLRRILPLPLWRGLKKFYNQSIRGLIKDS